MHRARTAALDKNAIHLVSYGRGGLFAEAVLLSRLIPSVSPDVKIQLSILWKGCLPLTAIVNDDEAMFRDEMDRGYNERFHALTSSHIAAFARLFPRSDKLEVRCYGLPWQLVADVESNEASRVDVLAFMDPDEEILAEAAGLRDVFKRILAETGSIVMSYALTRDEIKLRTLSLHPACGPDGLLEDHCREGSSAQDREAHPLLLEEVS